ncbi:MAG: PadR family transcriptional regulator [Candidatus Woesearchaeota archaeon]
MKNQKKPLKNIIEKKVNVNIKLVPKFIELKGFLSFFILHELNNTPLAGDELARIIGERKTTVLTPGTIYPALKRLRRQKLISYRRIGRKKVYSLTDLGSLELKSLYVVFSEFFSGLKKKIK